MLSPHHRLLKMSRPRGLRRSITGEPLSTPPILCYRVDSSGWWHFQEPAMTVAHLLGNATMGLNWPTLCVSKFVWIVWGAGGSETLRPCQSVAGLRLNSSRTSLEHNQHHNLWLIFLASQDALEVMRVTHSLTYLLTHWVSVSIDFTDVTLVSDDTYRRLYWCDPDYPDDPDESYLVMKVI